MHLNVGLQKIRETVDQVDKLQSSLSIKKNELEQKNALANQKLKQMVRGLGLGLGLDNCGCVYVYPPSLLAFQLRESRE